MKSINPTSIVCSMILGACFVIGCVMLADSDFRGLVSAEVIVGDNSPVTVAADSKSDTPLITVNSK